jgi:5-hydroxyisourate hydrolase-like protein (transthyretin family)
MMTKRTRTGLGRTLAAVLVVATLATSPLALAQTAETITGKVVNGTKDRPAAGVEVTLQLFSQQGDLGTVTDTTDERGRFAFEDLPEAVAGYQVIASYQGADFHTVAQAFTPGQTREDRL